MTNQIPHRLCSTLECPACERQMREGADDELKALGNYPAYFVPTRYYIESIRVGDLAPNCFGNVDRVTRITAQLDDWQGRAFVCYTVEFGASGSTISNSLKEGELHRTTRISHQHTAHELTCIERRILEERA